MRWIVLSLIVLMLCSCAGLMETTPSTSSTPSAPSAPSKGIFKLKWRRYVGRYSKPLWLFTSPDEGNTGSNGVSVYESHVTVGYCNGYVYVLDSKTGRLRWKFKKTGNWMYWPLV